MRGATSVSPESICFSRDSWASTADFLENGELCCCNQLCLLDKREGRGGVGESKWKEEVRPMERAER